jgi:DNA topoisomerase-1
MSKKNLVIVESPAKAKTIEKYLGSDFTVLSSIGHIRSIVKKTKDGTPPIDTKNGFKTIYEVDPDKKKTITELKKPLRPLKPSGLQPMKTAKERLLLGIYVKC